MHPTRKQPFPAQTGAARGRKKAEPLLYIENFLILPISYITFYSRCSGSQLHNRASMLHHQSGSRLGCRLFRLAHDVHTLLQHRCLITESLGCGHAAQNGSSLSSIDCGHTFDDELSQPIACKWSFKMAHVISH